MIDFKTQEGLEYLKKMKKQGKTQNDIAREYNTSSEQIRATLNKYHNTSWVELPPKTISTDELIREKGGLTHIIQLKNKGLSKQEVADEIGCSISSLDYYLKKSGVKWRDLGYRKDARSKYSYDEEKEVIQKAQTLIDKQYTSLEICRFLDVSDATLKNIFRRHKIPYNPLTISERKRLDKKYCETKKRNIERSRRQNSTGFYRVIKLWNGEYRYKANDEQIFYSNNILDLRRKVVEAGLDWIIVNPEKAKLTMEES